MGFRFRCNAYESAQNYETQHLLMIGKFRLPAHMPAPAPLGPSLPFSPAPCLP